MNNVMVTVLQYMQLMQPVGVPLAIVGIILTGIACFFGYRLQKIWIGLLGFLIGAVFGAWIASMLVDNSVIEMLIAIVAGFFVAVMAVAIYMFGVFIMCFFYGFGVTAAVSALFLENKMIALAVACCMGLVCAVLGVIFTKVVVIILSGLYGGLKVADFIMMFLSMKVGIYLLAGGAVFAIVGIIVQLLTTKNYTLDRAGDRIQAR